MDTIELWEQEIEQKEIKHQKAIEEVSAYMDKHFGGHDLNTIDKVQRILNVVKEAQKQDKYGKSAVMGYPLTDKKIKSLKIAIQDEDTEGVKFKEHLSKLDKDYPVISGNKLNDYIKEYFIPWLKSGQEATELSDNDILKGLKIYEITYHYQKIVAKYSPTNKDDYFGIFSVYFEASDSKLKSTLLPQAAEMDLYVKNNKVVKAQCSDV